MVIIVGAGLAGSILARVLDRERIKYKIYDCEKPWRASPISENLFSLTWKSTLGDKVFASGLKTLESIVDIKTINFKTKAGHNSVLHVHPNNILKPYQKRDCTNMSIAVDMVVDCRGYWANVGNYKMVGLTGQGLFINGKLDVEPEMTMVAPYTHQKLFQWDKKRIWYGDSTCVAYDKYCSDEIMYPRRCIERAAKLIPDLYERGYSVVNGIRPWVNKQKGFLSLRKNKIINTGGWKCGLIIYADHAQKIANYIKGL